MDAEVGFAQGSVVSPLLANIYLDPLDALMAERGYRMVRYADDFVILCRSREEADAALVEVRAWVSENGLTLHPSKTHVGDCRQPGQGFEFLGYRFEAGLRLVRKKSLDKLKDSIRAKTCRNRGDSLACVITDLNRVLRGWLLQAGPSKYVRCARQDDPKTAAIPADEAEQAVALRVRAQPPSPLAKCLLRECRTVRASHGLANSETVPMRKPPTGEPYAGKPPVRFGGRGGDKPSRPLSMGHGGRSCTPAPSFGVQQQLSS